MLKISDFARLGQVSMRTLRYYDEIGLLKPVQVDPLTGYRYYAVEQLTRLHRILDLKEMGFELSQIVHLLDEQVTPEQLRAVLQQRLAEVQQTIVIEQERQARIEARLQQLMLKDQQAHYDVVLKRLKSQLVATSRTTAPTRAQQLHFARQMLQFLKECGVKPDEQWLLLTPDATGEGEGSIVEVAIPVEGASLGNIVERSGGHITIRELPAVTAATLLYRGSPYSLSGVYQSLGTWIEAHGYAIAGPYRHLLLQQADESESCLIEVQLPVERKERGTGRLFLQSSRRLPEAESLALVTRVSSPGP
ncbi:MerR family transcriptional regulator [Thermogemmatispora sp.]|uniref:MerR family transcriptional regulator n=1 Tax=Thermogemmatispora sp. TaxID=1968838 RepID=UPI001DBFDD64|nr:MerR family transcriptional regulator [Thermogemmatispora sp.]MBX5449841.1 MerR family transcriptional regulator [Thermogemmatispora sp.]